MIIVCVFLYKVSLSFKSLSSLVFWYIFPLYDVIVLSNFILHIIHTCTCIWIHPHSFTHTQTDWKVLYSTSNFLTAGVSCDPPFALTYCCCSPPVTLLYFLNVPTLPSLSKSFNPYVKCITISVFNYLNSVLPYYFKGHVQVPQGCPELAQASLFLLVKVDPMSLSNLGLIFKPQRSLNTTRQGLCLCVCARG